MASLLQIEANRANAKKSRGPKTLEGKRVARTNAVRHGLAGAGVVVPDEDAEAVAQRRADWRGRFRLETPEDEWKFEQVVVNSVRVDRCQAQERELRAYLAGRARLCWEEDRRLAAEELGARLARDPARVVRRLRRTKQGADWLLQRWHALRAASAATGEWDESQSALAYDLLGVPAAFRANPPWAPYGSPDVLAARQIADLESLRRHSLDALDDAEHAAARQGHEVETSHALVLLRRYEAACLRRYETARKRLHLAAPSATPPPPPCPEEPEPAPESEPAPVSPPAPPVPDRTPVPTRAVAPASSPAIVSGPASAPRDPEPTASLRDAVPAPAPFLNRRQRRAAERLARRRR